ncbi:outer membrane protein transport protein [Vibrio misgurnus]|uniref:outer membrane protein transport protein n=1 Tax=Vibrio misgurnus TaxID=2993714 RepID=UPI002416A912|nr:outer membrane protein transport protein [Vibrio sp. gvc]
MYTNKTFLACAVALSLSSVATFTQAAGFQLAEYSATGLGRAYAGEAAIADNASAQWRNPALLTYLSGTQISSGAIYVNPNIDVNGTVSHRLFGSTNASATDFAHDAVIPNFYLSHQLNEQFAVGLALGTNYGMETDLGTEFAAAHFGNQASVISKELNLNIAYQIQPQLSIGAGVRYVIGEGHFGATAPTDNLFGVAQGTTLKYMEGEDTAWGWQIGSVWQINDFHRLGFTYKSKVSLKLAGHAEGFGFNEIKGDTTKFYDSGSMNLDLPATAEIASHHQLSEHFALHTSINWTEWSSFKELYANLDHNDSSKVKDENWKDNYRFALGATYQIQPKLALRTGIAYDISAVSDKNRTITIPETDRTWLSLGATYDVSKQLSVDTGFTYIFAKNAQITESRGYDSDNDAQLLGGKFSGGISGNVWLIGVQANYRF